MANWVQLPNGNLVNTDTIQTVDRSELSISTLDNSGTAQTQTRTDVRFDVAFVSGATSFLSEQDGQALCDYLERGAYICPVGG